MKTRGSTTTSKTVSPGAARLPLIGAIFLLTGLLVMVLGVVLTVSERSFYATAAHTDGVVVDVEEHWSRDTGGKSGETYCPVVEFTAGGNKYTFEDNACGSGVRDDVGRSVTVAYQVDDPDDARIQGGWFSENLAPLVAIPLGLLFAAIGVALLVVSRRELSSSAAAAG